MRSSESASPNTSKSTSAFCGREKGGNSKRMCHSGYRGNKEERYIQMANVSHQSPSTILESNNLVCKSKEMKYNPDRHLGIVFTDTPQLLCLSL